jgi:hypothetical protein
LPDEHETRRLQPLSVACLHGVAAGDEALAARVCAQEGNRMIAQRTQ